MSTEEAERLAEDLVKSGERQWEDINAKISDAMRAWLDSMDLVRRRDLQDLRTRVELLEQRVIVLEDARRAEKGVLGEY